MVYHSDSNRIISLSPCMEMYNDFINTNTKQMHISKTTKLCVVNVTNEGYFYLVKRGWVV